MPIVQGEIVAGRMQRARDRRADALRGAGDQCDRSRFGGLRHERQVRASFADNTCMRIGLPEPAVEEREHGERLRTLIVRAIEAAGGALDFARYMELALYAPG